MKRTQKVVLENSDEVDNSRNVQGSQVDKTSNLQSCDDSSISGERNTAADDARDAERYRKAIALSDNAESLYAAVLNHWPYKDDINAEFDAYKPSVTNMPIRDELDEKVNEELRLCPFCGGEPQTDFIVEGSHIIECHEVDCGAKTGEHDSAASAIAAWNRRSAVLRGDGVRGKSEALLGQS